jgi:hypothetical protein
MGEWYDMDSVCIPSLDQVNGFDLKAAIPIPLSMVSRCADRWMAV